MSSIPPTVPDDRVPRRHLQAAPEITDEQINDTLVVKSPDSRRMIADWLERQAEHEATGSRDFGRGFMHAVRVLRAG